MTREPIRIYRLAVAITFATLLATAFGAAASRASNSAGASLRMPQPVVTPPPTVAAAHQLVVCSDEVEPPFAYRQGSTLTGSEIDITTSAARDMGVKVAYRQIGFDGLFAALGVHKCDVAIDEVSDTIAREQSILDVDYMAVGQTFVVKTGNPQHLVNFTSLCGHSVGAVLASVDLTQLQAVSKRCVSGGKPAVHIVGFNDDPTGIEALATGKIDAFEEDTPILAGLIARANGQIEFSPQPQVNRIPVGLAVAHGNTGLAKALQKILNRLYAGGQMAAIFRRYHERGVALSGSRPVKLDAAASK